MYAHIWATVLLWFISCLVDKSYNTDSQNYIQHWLLYPTTKSKTVARSRQALLRSWQRKNVGVKENTTGKAGHGCWGSKWWELELQEETGVGIERATANRDRWHCKCRLVTGGKPESWRRTAFSRKTLCSVAGNFVVCPRESWKLGE